jgi:carbon-monoxide dehydrogenase medium subunit
MKLWSKYHVAHSVDEALALLQQYEGAAQIIAGGTDLLIDLQQAGHDPKTALIDITQIADMTQVEVAGDLLTLGAGVTHNTIVQTPILAERATCLVESCGVVGGPQVRNVATIGGNVAHALPAADGTLSLVALGAEAEVASLDGRRWYDIREMFLGPGKSRVDATRQLITRFRFPLTGARAASAFHRVMRPQGVALPILGCAVRVALGPAGGAGVFSQAAICLGPVGPTPTRATEIEAFLVGKPATDATIDAAADVGRQALHPRTSKYRATAEYRAEMIGLLLRKSLSAAVARAQSAEGRSQ